MSTSAVLVLNFSYEALNLTSIKRAIRLVFSGKAEVLHDKGSIATVSHSFRMPSVIRMLYFIRRSRKSVPLTKRNVLLRDDYKCGYCEKRGEHSSMTVDHIVPRSRGGPSAWENLVACCSPCNSRKRNRMPSEAGMPLKGKPPRQPRVIPFLTIQRHTAPGEWGKYLFWDIAIDERME